MSSLFRTAIALAMLVVLGSCTAGPGPGKSIWDVTSGPAGTWSVVGVPNLTGYGMDSPQVAVNASGIIDVAVRDWNYGGAISVHRFDGTSWQMLGPGGLTGGNSSFPCLVLGPDGLPIVAYINSSNMAEVHRFDGSAWTNLGPGPTISAGTVSDISMAIRGDQLYCGYSDQTVSGKLVVRAFDAGSNTWNDLGGGPATPAGVWYTHMAVDTFGNPWVSFNDPPAGNDTSVVRWDGGSWIFAGPEGLFSTTSQTMSLGVDPAGVPWLVGNSNSLAGAHALKWVGGSWAVAGPTVFSAGNIVDSTLSFGPGGVPWFAYGDQVNGGRATVKVYTGTQWITVGTEGFTSGTVSGLRATVDGQGHVYIVYQDPVTTGADVEVYR